MDMDAYVFACSVRARDAATREPVGDVCGEPAMEEWDDELVAMVNEMWTEYHMGNTICDAHLEHCPEV